MDNYLDDNNHPQKILILFAHPSIEQSRVNIKLIEPLNKINNITFHDLYETYPDFHIDINFEQNLLLKHDIIVFMHPFYWYSTPPILKQWMDLVLEYGFAYGENADALRNKSCLSIITTSGQFSGYKKDGLHRYTIKELLAPIEQTAYLCGMNYLPPIVLHEALNATTEQIINHSTIIKNILLNLSSGKIDLIKTQQSTPYLNGHSLDDILI